ncbi:HTH_Tnp_Tc3_2 domain-containing protein [Trichonephila clavipes]|nr:HTH_Tnp_Tc3_2 domain-containing protein [Trichonephila clavipes]
MGRSDAAFRRCWQEWVYSDRFQRHDGSSRSRVTADREDRLIVRSAVTAPDSSLSTIRRAIHTLSNTSLPNHITRYFSHRACLGYDGKARLHLSGNVEDLIRQLEQIWQEIPQETIKVL